MSSAASIIFQINRIFQACKQLDEISKIREVWINQYLRYSSERLRRPRLEGPLESYSSEDLERWVLLRRSADIGWKSEDVKFTRTRQIRRAHTWGSLIVPGGRWLLVGGKDGSLTTYDLEAPTLEGDLLTPGGDHEEPAQRIAIDMDSGKRDSHLTFTLTASPALHTGKATNICEEK